MATVAKYNPIYMTRLYILWLTWQLPGHLPNREIVGEHGEIVGDVFMTHEVIRGIIAILSCDACDFGAVISDAFPNLGICESCLEEKQTWLSYSSSKNNHTFSLKIIRTDFCHILILFIKRYKNFVIFTDQVIWMSFKFFVHDKKSSTVLEVFEKFKECIELHFYLKEYKIKAIWMNDESEYQIILKDFLVEKKITSDNAIYYFSESTEISECLNRTLLDMTDSILFEVNLSSKLWMKAVFTAIYLKNWLSYSSLHKDITSHEM